MHRSLKSSSRSTRRSALILEHRQLAKLKCTYVDALPGLVDADGRLHTTYQQAATATGRLSSIDPNLQNIPIRTELGRRDPPRLRGADRRASCCSRADYSPDGAAASWRTSPTTPAS